MDTTNPTAYEDLGPTRLSTCSATPSPRKPPAEVRRLIGELGLRYRPSAQADLEAHAAAIALLARDLADVPAYHLSRAIDEWVRESKFMPKASELAAVAKRLSVPSGFDPVEYGNANLRREGRYDIHWYRDENKDLKLGPVGE